MREELQKGKSGKAFNALTAVAENAKSGISAFKIKRSVQNNYIVKDIEVIDSTKTERFQEKVKAITLVYFTELINKSGLKIIDIFGNYMLEDFNPLTSDRLILICNK